MAIRMTGPSKSVADMMEGMNVTGQARTEKALFSSERKPAKAPAIIERTPTQKWLDENDAPPSAYAWSNDRVEAEKISMAAPKEKRGEGKGVNTTLRLRPEVVEAWKAHFPQHTAAMKRMIEEFARDQGWL